MTFAVIMTYICFGVSEAECNVSDPVCHARIVLDPCSEPVTAVFGPRHVQLVVDQHHVEGDGEVSLGRPLNSTKVQLQSVELQKKTNILFGFLG